MADDAENAAPVNQRRSFTREFKLNVVGHYYHHGKNTQNTAQHFNVDRKQVREWLKNEQKLNKQEKGTRADGHGRVAFHRAMEEKLHKDFGNDQVVVVRRPAFVDF